MMTRSVIGYWRCSAIDDFSENDILLLYLTVKGICFQLKKEKEVLEAIVFAYFLASKTTINDCSEEKRAKLLSEVKEFLRMESLKN
jgi:hypothetical protein